MNEVEKHLVMRGSEVNEMVYASDYDKLKALLEPSAVAKELIAARAEIFQLKEEIAQLKENAVDTIDDLYIEIRKLKAQLDEALELLVRYRSEVPLGHQPHMAAHKVDAWLERNK